MKGKFDFTVDNLGPCKVPSPIQLSKKHGDFKANYVKDNITLTHHLFFDNNL